MDGLRLVGPTLATESTRVVPWLIPRNVALQVFVCASSAHFVRRGRQSLYRIAVERWHRGGRQSRL